MDDTTRTLRMLVEAFCAERGIGLNGDGQGTFFFARAEAPELRLGVQAVPESGVMLVQARLGALDRGDDTQTLRAMLQANIGLAAAGGPVYALNAETDAILAVRSVPLTAGNGETMSPAAFGMILTGMAIDAAAMREAVANGTLRSFEPPAEATPEDSTMIFRG